MPDFILGIALIAALIVLWGILVLSRPGRVAQAIIASLFYLAWLAIIPLVIYFVASNIRETVSEGRIGATVFISLFSLTLIPILIFPLIPWNYYCLFVWRKTGFRLPQTERLAGRRDYYDWERER
jgi:hypothetical protein